MQFAYAGCQAKFSGPINMMGARGGRADSHTGVARSCSQMRTCAVDLWSAGLLKAGA